MMKPLLIPMLVVPALVSCVGNPGDQAVQRELKNQNIVALSPFQGDPTRKAEWEKYGPGAVRSVKNKVSAGNTLRSATSATGDPTLSSKSMDREDHTPVSFPHRLTVHTDSSGNLSAESLYSEAVKVAANASHQRITRVDMTLENVRKSEPLTAEEMKSKLKASGFKRRWGQRVILAPVIVDSITYTFYRETSGNGEVKVNIPKAAKADASAKQLKVTNGQLETTKPTFIGFYPM